MPEKAYIAIDLKSFYASVECVERGLDPLTTNLVVADESRTTKTICLAATPALLLSSPTVSPAGRGSLRWCRRQGSQPPSQGKCAKVQT